MFRNLLKISLRLLWRDRFFSLLNLTGLATGLAAAVLMFLWVRDEWSFDRFHRHGERTYRVVTNWQFGENREWIQTTPAPLAEEARVSVPGLDKILRTWNLGNETFSVGANRADLEKVSLAENGFFDIFDFEFIVGSPQNALANPQNIVLTESAARKVFGKIPALGESLRHADKGDFQVGGVVRDLPTNSSIRFDAILPWETNIQKFARNPKNALNWGMINYGTWALLRPDADPAAVAAQLSDISGRYRSGDEAFYYALQPLRDIHLYSSFISRGEFGDLGTVRTVGAIGLLILLIACINYVNLTTARAGSRVRSVGIRQTIGARKVDLFGQSMLESGLTVAAATLLAAALAWLSLPFFENISGKEFTPQQIFSGATAAVLGCTALVAWLLSGIQPALQLTRFRPVTAMKGEVQGVGKTWLRKSLVTVQFVFSIGLGICALLMWQQLKYVREAKLGYDREHTFMVFVPGDKALLLKSELQNQPGVVGVTTSDNPFVDLGSQVSGDDWETKQPDQASDLWTINVDGDFPQFFGLQLASGRWFNPGNADSLSFVINESAAKMMLLQEPLGKWIEHGGKRGTIVGVAKDFHFQSLHTAIEPMIFSQVSDWLYVIYVKTTGASTAQAIASTQQVFQKIFPEKVFDYTFLDDQYNDLYKAENRAGQLTGWFTGLALFISCLGLFGLATFAAAQRTKEIGIRKVLGASVAGIAGLLAGDFLQLVLLALVLASPVAWWAMRHWLADFAYRIDIGWQAFAVVGFAAIVLAFLTVSSQAVRAALLNPVKSLRSE